MVVTEDDVRVVMKVFIGGNVKKLLSFFVAVTALVTSFSIVPAHATPGQAASFGDSNFTFQAEPYSGDGNPWSFVATRPGGFRPGDSIEVKIVDSTGKQISSDYEYLSSYGLSAPELRLDLRSYASLTSAQVVLGLRLMITYSDDNYKTPDLNFNYAIPAQVFPTAPASKSQFVSFAKAAYTFDRTLSCGYQTVDFKIEDPYEEIRSVQVSLQTPKGDEIDSQNLYPDLATGINFVSFFLCPSDFDERAGKNEIVATIDWYSSGLPPVVLTSDVEISSLSKAAREAVSKLKKFCFKGSSYKSTQNANCPSGYKKAIFATPTVIQWNSLSRNPSGSTGGKFRVFACIAQFDSVTGSSSFRAYATRSESSSYYSGVNSYFKGDKKQLLSYSEDDLVIADVTVLGKYSYSTLGGGTSVPFFQIRDIKKVGTC
jgi:hypothetical protein